VGVRGKAAGAGVLVPGSRDLIMTDSCCDDDDHDDDHDDDDQLLVMSIQILKCPIENRVPVQSTIVNHIARWLSTLSRLHTSSAPTPYDILQQTLSFKSVFLATIPFQPVHTSIDTSKIIISTMQYSAYYIFEAIKDGSQFSLFIRSCKPCSCRGSSLTQIV